MNAHVQFSLRELLCVVLFAGLGLASLRMGGVLASITILLAMLATMAWAIIAFTGIDRLRVFAIGFLVPVIAYAITVWAVGPKEMDPYQGKLPTSRLLGHLFPVLGKQMWVDNTTGKELPDYDPSRDGGGGFGAGGLGVGGFAVGGVASVGYVESPDRQTFMSVGHVLIAMLLGYGGARFAVAVHRSRRRQEDLAR